MKRKLSIILLVFTIFLTLSCTKKDVKDIGDCMIDCTKECALECANKCATECIIKDPDIKD